MRNAARFLLPLALALMSAPAAAQRLPGAPPTDPAERGVARHQYTQDVLRAHEALVRRWMEAWAEGDVKAVGRSYAETATVVFDAQEKAQGKGAVEQWLRRSVPEMSEVRTALTDFRASGALAYAYGTFSYQPRSAPGESAAQVTGTYVAVLVEERGRWKYQTQVFIPDAPQAPAPAVGGN